MNAYDLTASSYLNITPEIYSQLKNEATYALEPFLKRLQQCSKILDIGCGVGLSANICGSCDLVSTVIAIDTSSKMLEGAVNCNNGRKIDFILMDFRDMDIENFDGIVIRAFLHLFPVSKLRQHILPKLSRMLPKKGLIHLSTSIHEEFREGFEEKSSDKSAIRYRVRFTEEAIVNLISDFFKILDIRKTDEITNSAKKTWINITASNEFL